MVTQVLFKSPDGGFEHPHIECTIYTIGPYTPRGTIGVNLMRTVFNIEIKTDIPANDEARRQALIELFTRVSRELLTKATLVSKGVSPDFKLSSIDNEKGEQEYPLF